MSTLRFIESIKVLDGKIHNWLYHEARMNATMKTFFEQETFFKHWQPAVEQGCEHGLYKCRLAYGEEGISEITFSKYERRHYHNLVFVKNDHLNYSYKYEDRDCLIVPNRIFVEDEAVVFVKHGLITDSTYYNIALYSEGQWCTPKHPLLKGVRRAKLLAEGRIKERVILHEDFFEYERISFINALNDLDEVSIDLK